MSGPESVETLLFDCAGEELVGILHRPAVPSRRGVVIVVGGPQYRIGSHRQFRSLAGAVAAAGFACLRFDYRGMGDASGEPVAFEHVGDDIRAACAALRAAQPGTEEIVLWGLCDAASAAMIHAADTPGVAGLVLVNPWARTGQGLARAHLKSYYLRKLASREFWRQLFSGGVDVGAALKGLAEAVARRFGAGAAVAAGGPVAPHFTARMYDGLQRFDGPVLLILSEDDLTAAEFREFTGASREWRALLAAPRVQTEKLAGANHTYSRSDWRELVHRWTTDWLASR